MKILFVAAEGAPFAKTGGLGDVIGALPKSLVKNNNEVSVILPYYDVVDAKFGDQIEDLFYFFTNVVNMLVSNISSEMALTFTLLTISIIFIVVKSMVNLMMVNALLTSN